MLGRVPQEPFSYGAQRRGRIELSLRRIEGLVRSRCPVHGSHGRPSAPGSRGERHYESRAPRNSATRDAERPGWAERPLPLRQRAQVQEVLRRRRTDPRTQLLRTSLIVGGTSRARARLPSPNTPRVKLAWILAASTYWPGISIGGRKPG